VLASWVADPTPAHLLIVDPYDLFDHWGALRNLLAKASSLCPTLVYLYNKSPRGAGYFDQYRRLLAGLGQALPRGVSGIVGRVPSDARLPRAWHEVVLLGADSLVGEVGAELERAARELASHLASSGAFERLSRPR
jgi:hypothetical protein